MITIARWIPKHLVTLICTFVSALALAADPSALAQAVLGSDLQAARRAIDDGAPVNAVDPVTGHAPLHTAVALGGPRYRDMVELLVSKNADVDAVDAATQMPPLAAAMVVTDSGPFATLERSRAANIVDALLAAGANPNQTLKAGESPLMLAVSMNNLSALQSLLARGANPNLRDAQQSSALHVAYALDRSSAFTDALTAAGADPTLRDAQGKLPHELSSRFIPPAPAAAVETTPAAVVAPVPDPVPTPPAPPASSMNKWLLGGAVVATAVVGSVILAHLVKEQKKKKAGQGSPEVASPILPVAPPTLSPAPQPTPAADLFQGKYASQTVLADGFTHTERANVEGTTVALNHEFISRDGRTTGSFRWSGTLRVIAGTPARAEISGQGAINNQGVRNFILDNASIVVKPNGDIELCWKATDPKYGAIGNCSKRGYVIPDGTPNLRPGPVPAPVPAPPVVTPPVPPVARPDPNSCTTIAIMNRKAVHPADGYPNDPCAHSFDHQVAIAIRSTCLEPVVVAVEGWGPYFGADGKQGRVDFGQIVNSTRQFRVCGEPRGVCYQTDYASGNNCKIRSGLRLFN
jgi:hypothetical protein